jgi:hypothetical protein
MHPFRAFLLSFAAGLAVLFAGHGIASVAFAGQPSDTITA